MEGLNVKVRKGFVSNSSSSSFIVISDKINKEKIEWHSDYYTIGAEGCTEFGWQLMIYDDIHSKINFTYTQIQYIGNKSKKMKEKYTEWLYSIISNIFRVKIKNILVVKDTGYIDHASSAIENANIEMFESINKMKAFILSSDSKINNSNDNM